MLRCAPAGAQPGVDGILAGHTQHWQLPMLAVFDGMGGESCGEMAASAAVEALGGFYEENKKTLKKEPVVFSDRSLRKI